MTAADVNVTEPVARAVDGLMESEPLLVHVPDWRDGVEAARDAILAALRSPEVVAGIAGVIETTGRDIVDCPHETAAWPCPRCKAQAVADWLTGGGA